MATIKFDICQLSDRTGLQLWETTGREPIYEGGYEEFEDISAYTAALKIYKGTDLISSYSLVPNASLIPYRISYEAEDNEQLGDGVYKAVYTVYNAGLPIGDATAFLLINNQLLDDMESLIEASIRECPDCTRAASLALGEIHGGVRGAYTLLQGSNYLGAVSVFDHVKNVMGSYSCKCN